MAGKSRSSVGKCPLCDGLLFSYVHNKYLTNMGILGLSKLIADIAPEAIKERELKHYFGRYFYVSYCVLSVGNK